MEMKRVNFVALAVVTVAVFVASSIWYSPLLFGRQFLELSGATANAHPSPMRGLFELLRTFVLAFVIAQLVLRLNSANWKRAVGIGAVAMGRLSCHPPDRVHSLAERPVATRCNTFG